MGGDPPRGGPLLGGDRTLRAVLDTNVLIRHLTGDPPDQGKRATRFLKVQEDLLLLDAVVSECVFVLESAYRLDRNVVAQLMRSVIVFDSIRVINEPLLSRALERYESLRLHFVDSYLVACAELFPDVGIASFDRSIDRASSVQRVEP